MLISWSVGSIFLVATFLLLTAVTFVAVLLFTDLTALVGFFALLLVLASDFFITSNFNVHKRVCLKLQIYINYSFVTSENIQA